MKMRGRTRRRRRATRNEEEEEMMTTESTMDRFPSTPFHALNCFFLFSGYSFLWQEGGGSYFFDFSSHNSNDHQYQWRADPLAMSDPKIQANQ